MSCPAHDLAASRNFLQVTDVDLIIDLCRQFPADEDISVVDLGAGSGTTALSVFAARGDHCHVLTIDSSQDALHWSGLAVSNAGRQEQWRGHLGPSHSPPPDFHEAVRLLLIDADHSYAAVRQDFRSWLPFLSSDALVWFHDFLPSSSGVNRAVSLLARTGSLIPYCQRGLGWAGRLP